MQKRMVEPRMFLRMDELPSPGDLIAAAKRAFGVSSDHDLALRLFARYGITTSQSAVSRYRRGLVDSGPSFEMTIAMLDKAGWLDEHTVAGDLRRGVTREDEDQKVEGPAAAGRAEAEALEEEIRRLERPDQERPRSETG